jgi:hypothetical protein
VAKLTHQQVDKEIEGILNEETAGGKANPEEIKRKLLTLAKQLPVEGK